MISLSFVYFLTAGLQLHFMFSESLDIGLEARVDELENQNEAMLQQLAEYKEKNELLTEKLNVLSNVLTNVHLNMLPNFEHKRQTSPEAVAFTAYISHNPTHLNDGQIIPFDRTVTNIGDAFNVHSHMFICPVGGLYMFSFVMCQLGTSNAETQLVVDGVHIVDAITNPITGDHDQQGVNMAFVQVKKGQTVFVKNYFYSDISYRSEELHRFASFSGVLLQEM
ncbi:caprin-2-like isoform X2 [Dreissena polymorpha]|uniref:caprin-2-like isoform X2 n=1 Tax=Dreissena polymorpha TaxID=45954 RepID=UPI002263FD5A|nr:caprin-2-like isoform X2 [Dreissena polymorpha]